MNVSAKTEYACIAILELAMRYEQPEPVRIRTIADAHGIPARFLVQILLQLKGAGLVNSTRGASGGYQLNKSPDQITLGEVMGTIEGKTDCIESCANIGTPVSRVLNVVWNNAADELRARFAGITFADLAERLSQDTNNMYYI